MFTVCRKCLIFSNNISAIFFKMGPICLRVIIFLQLIHEARKRHSDSLIQFVFKCLTSLILWMWSISAIYRVVWCRLILDHVSIWSKFSFKYLTECFQASCWKYPLFMRRTSYALMATHLWLRLYKWRIIIWLLVQRSFFFCK